MASPWPAPMLAQSLPSRRKSCLIGGAVRRLQYKPACLPERHRGRPTSVPQVDRWSSRSVTATGSMHSLNLMDGRRSTAGSTYCCLLYTSDAADDLLCV